MHENCFNTILLNLFKFNIYLHIIRRFNVVNNPFRSNNKKPPLKFIKISLHFLFSSTEVRCTHTGPGRIHSKSIFVEEKKLYGFDCKKKTLFVNCYILLNNLYFF